MQIEQDSSGDKTNFYRIQRPLRESCCYDLLIGCQPRGVAHFHQTMVFLAGQFLRLISAKTQ